MNNCWKCLPSLFSFPFSSLLFSSLCTRRCRRLSIPCPMSYSKLSCPMSYSKLSRCHCHGLELFLKMHIVEKKLSILMFVIKNIEFISIYVWLEKSKYLYRENVLKKKKKFFGWLIRMKKNCFFFILQFKKSFLCYKSFHVWSKIFSIQLYNFMIFFDLII